mmetsp:Transcript_29768/g.42247  ORF Transcript_29768/g.42247 Transcript_29768/m.42247 type:complete len:325 (-) Transcript_29768:199-1173(-)
MVSYHKDHHHSLRDTNSSTEEVSKSGISVYDDNRPEQGSISNTCNRGKQKKTESAGHNGNRNSLSDVSRFGDIRSHHHDSKDNRSEFSSTSIARRPGLRGPPNLHHANHIKSENSAETSNRSNGVDTISIPDKKRRRFCGDSDNNYNRGDDFVLRPTLEVGETARSELRYLVPSKRHKLIDHNFHDEEFKMSFKCLYKDDNDNNGRKIGYVIAIRDALEIGKKFLDLKATYHRGFPPRGCLDERKANVKYIKLDDGYFEVAQNSNSYTYYLDDEHRNGGYANIEYTIEYCEEYRNTPLLAWKVIRPIRKDDKLRAFLINRMISM